MNWFPMVGGGNSIDVSELEIYGKIINQSVSTLLYDFYDGSAVVYNNEIHILGSYASGNYTKHYKWDGKSWTSVSTLPYNFYYGSAVVLGNEIHILGTNDSDSSSRTKHYLIEKLYYLLPRELVS